MICWKHYLKKFSVSSSCSELPEHSTTRLRAPPDELVPPSSSKLAPARDASVSFWPAPPRSRLQAPPHSAGARARVREGAGGEAVAAKLPEARLARPPPPWPERPPGRPGPAMIKAILIFNNHGKPRLSKFYQPYVSMPLSRTRGEGERRRRAAPSGFLRTTLATPRPSPRPTPAPLARLSPRAAGAACHSPPAARGLWARRFVRREGRCPPARHLRSSTAAAPLPVPLPCRPAWPGGLLSVARGQMGHCVVRPNPRQAQQLWLAARPGQCVQCVSIWKPPKPPCDC